MRPARSADSPLLAPIFQAIVSFSFLLCTLLIPFPHLSQFHHTHIEQRGLSIQPLTLRNSQSWTSTPQLHPPRPRMLRVLPIHLKSRRKHRLAKFLTVKIRNERCGRTHSTRLLRSLGSSALFPLLLVCVPLSLFLTHSPSVYRNPIASEECQQVVGALSSLLKDLPPRPTKKDGKSASNIVKVAVDQKSKFAELVIGLNSVTRALENDELRLVISTRDLSPSRVIQHLPVLCAMRQIPLCPLSMTSQALAQLMGASEIRTVICFGFKRVEGVSVWDDIVSLVSSKSPAIDVPWIPPQGSAFHLSSIVGRGSEKASDMKTKRLQTLGKLKVRKIQHTAPIKPPKQSIKPAKKASSTPSTTVTVSKRASTATR